MRPRATLSPKGCSSRPCRCATLHAFATGLRGSTRTLRRTQAGRAAAPAVEGHGCARAGPPVHVHGSSCALAMPVPMPLAAGVTAAWSPVKLLLLAATAAPRAASSPGHLAGAMLRPIG